MEHLCAAPQLQMKAPGLTTTTEDGRNRTLYMATVPSIERATKPNLKKTLQGKLFGSLCFCYLSICAPTKIATLPNICCVIEIEVLVQ